MNEWSLCADYMPFSLRCLTLLVCKNRSSLIASVGHFPKLFAKGFDAGEGHENRMQQEHLRQDWYPFVFGQKIPIISAQFLVRSLSREVFSGCPVDQSVADDVHNVTVHSLSAAVHHPVTSAQFPKLVIESWKSWVGCQAPSFG